MQLTEHVAYELRDAIAFLTLTRPHSRNALSPPLAKGILMGIEAVLGDRRVRALVLSGEGPVFCAGGDIKVFAAEGIDAEQAGAVHDGLLGLHRLPIPVIGAIQGAAIGYGLGLACACDIRVAADDAIFQAGFTAIGLSPDSTTSYFLPRLLGPSIAARMILTNLPLPAAEAKEKGFVASVHPVGALAEAAASLAQRVAALPSGALRRAKALLAASLDNSAEAQVDRELAMVLESLSTADFREGATAFVERRTPRFSRERQ